MLFLLYGNISFRGVEAFTHNAFWLYCEIDAIHQLTWGNSGSMTSVLPDFLHYKNVKQEILLYTESPSVMNL